MDIKINTSLAWSDTDVTEISQYSEQLAQMMHIVMGYIFIKSSS
jgi:hypothetical protein